MARLRQGRRPQEKRGKEISLHFPARDNSVAPHSSKINPIEIEYTFVQQFTQMLRTRAGEQLDGWLQAVASSPLTDLQSFVGSVYEDKEATLAGLTREESNGPTEGHITRLKLIKRSRYGRAKFDLLRLRVLSHPQRAQDAKMQADHKQREGHRRKLKAGQIAPILQHTTFGSSEVA